MLAPAILAGPLGEAFLFLFYPQLPAPTFIGAVAAWAQGIGVAAFALTPLALTDRDGRPVPA